MFVCVYRCHRCCCCCCWSLVMVMATASLWLKCCSYWPLRKKTRNATVNGQRTNVNARVKDATTIEDPRLVGQPCEVGMRRLRVATRSWLPIWLKGARRGVQQTFAEDHDSDDRRCKTNANCVAVTNPSWLLQALRLRPGVRRALSNSGPKGSKIVPDTSWTIEWKKQTNNIFRTLPCLTVFFSRAGQGAEHLMPLAHGHTSNPTCISRASAWPNAIRRKGTFPP